MNIGLIAMSGVRACDPELLRLGLTLPGFVERSRTIASLPSLGLLTLAGMTPPRHTCRYIEISDLRDTPGLPDVFDLVAISSFSAQIGEAYELADRYRARGIPVVLGGLHVTAMPDEAAAHADAVVTGEGELSWHEILSDAEGGRLKPRYASAGREFDFADAPMPAYAQLDIARYNRLTVQTSRGCPWRCEFCASSIMLTERFKQKPAQRVLAEIDRIRALWPRPFIEFADDNSFINRRYWKALLPELAARHIKWFSETDLAIHEDPELLRLMRASGCAEVLIGFESPTESGLLGLETRTDWKRRRWPEYEKSIAAIQSAGIRVNGCFILGLDAHDARVFDDVYEFAVRSELFDVQITMLTPFPGTPLHARLRREGRLLEERGWEKCTLFDVMYEPKRMSVAELRQGFRDLSSRLYAEDITNWRRENFKKKYRRGARGAHPSSRGS